MANTANRTPRADARPSTTRHPLVAAAMALPLAVLLAMPSAAWTRWSLRRRPWPA